MPESLARGAQDTTDRPRALVNGARLQAGGCATVEEKE